MFVRSLISNSRAALGFVLPAGDRLRFTATDPRLEELDGAVFDNADAVRHLADAVLATGGGPASQALLALLERMPGRAEPDPPIRS
ncbi:hypothetical protein [Paracraurococcus lichenis]|uniref:Uncharacterized protein n=1 Tax=Paracraurococcus lichenis TaxID=3064888 RepID=A0ABT9E9J8_9PROT|nr:hypothetical protein [Paracraurococcus sp. LOR1-02]MDO9712870.1 hypothetical protein [Paracraurococcus sp. LOR1-02]